MSKINCSTSRSSFLHTLPHKLLEQYNQQLHDPIETCPESILLSILPNSTHPYMLPETPKLALAATISALILQSLISPASCFVPPRRIAPDNDNLQFMLSPIRKHHSNVIRSSFQNTARSSIVKPLYPDLYPSSITGHLRHTTHQLSNGFSGDLCTTDAQCAGPRHCVHAELLLPCSTSSGCLCLPIDPRDFACGCRNRNCLQGDVCSIVGDKTVCTSSAREFPPIDCGGPGNFTGDMCTTNDDCAGPRSCYRDTTSTGNSSFCLPASIHDLRCSCQDPDCLDGDECKVASDGTFGCISTNLVRDPLPCDVDLKFTGERCTTNIQCAGPRSCVDVETREPCDNMTECLCMPQVRDDLRCSCGDEECLFGDVCSVLSNNSPVCISENFDLPALVCPNKGPGEPCLSADECESNFCADATDQLRPCTGSPGCICLPKKNERIKKFTFEECVSNTECAGLRVCAHFNPAELCAFTDLEPDQNCVCIPMIHNQWSCSCINDNCVEGDICAGNSRLSEGKPQQGTCTSSRHSGLSRLDCTPRLPLPLSELPSPQPSSQPETVDSTLQPTTPPSPSPSATLQVCIDATALSHLHPHQLLYKFHPLATVLCDQFGSCATPGHIVRYKRSTMMMKTYCRINGCTQHTMQVNSPRYTRGIRVESKTSGLQYTAFAARHETRAEESIMALAVRLGL